MCSRGALFVWFIKLICFSLALNSNQPDVNRDLVLWGAVPIALEDVIGEIVLWMITQTCTNFHSFRLKHFLLRRMREKIKFVHYRIYRRQWWIQKWWFNSMQNFLWIHSMKDFKLNWKVLNFCCCLILGCRIKFGNSVLFWMYFNPCLIFGIWIFHVYLFQG